MTRLFAVLSMALAFQATAGELDQDVSNQALQGTVIIRIDQRDNSVSFLQADKAVNTENEAIALTQGDFKTVPAANLKKELDNEGGASSWYYYYAPYNYYYNNCLNWGGYNYYPYYSYNYGNYNYAYYGGYYGGNYGWNRGGWNHGGWGNHRRW